MIALLGLLEHLEVGGQRLLRLPGGPVDALEHRLVLAPAPVRARGTQQLERGDPVHGGDVRAAAQVRPGHLAVHPHVAVDGEGRTVGRVEPLLVLGRRTPDVHGTDDGAGIHQLDDLDLVGLLGELLEGVLARDDLTHEALLLPGEFDHPGLDRLEVLGGERPSDVEVVVEAVLDGWPDRPLGTREQIGHRLGHQVRGGVTQDGSPLLAGRFDHTEVDRRLGGREGTVEVPHVGFAAVGADRGRDDLSADGFQRLEGLNGGGARLELLGGLAGPYG